MKKLLINASNLHVGGGVQVATSVISELAADQLFENNVSFLVSDEIYKNISSSKLRELCRKVNFLRGNVFGIDPFNFKFRKIINKHDKVFTIFGPLYRLRTPGQSIVGFAQPWIIFPENEVYSLIPWRNRIIQKIKYWIQSQYYKRADLLVVEIEHVKHGLVNVLNIDPERIHVIHNCVSATFLDEASWQPLEMPDPGDVLRLGFLGRNYVHKNTAVFPRIVGALRDRHGIDARVFVTFTEEEWRVAGADFRTACINVGPLSAAQCPSFYQGLDAVVFPSLLECFSATPLEAMVMERPLFASDRPFNRDICGSHATYFDPLSAESAADEIARVFRAGSPDPEKLSAAREHALTFASPSDRARQYLALLMQDDSKKN